MPHQTQETIGTLETKLFFPIIQPSFIPVSPHIFNHSSVVVPDYEEIMVIQTQISNYKLIEMVKYPKKIQAQPKIQVQPTEQQLIKKQKTTLINTVSEPKLLEDKQFAHLSLQLHELIEAGNFQKTFNFLERHSCLRKDHHLGAKLIGILFKEINSLKEFCDELAGFPARSGLMSKAFAFFARNKKFLEDYNQIKLAAAQENQLSPIIISLLKNCSYNVGAGD